ncbi:MAG: phasin family protein [Paracoccaceae bacterium]
MAQTDKSKEAEKGPITSLNAAQADGLGMMGLFGTAMMETMTRYSAEVAEFMSKRLQEDVKTQHEILHCRDMDRLAEIQSRFFKTAMEQYTAETGKLMKISNEALKKTQ